MIGEYSLRLATAADISTLVEHRRAMLIDNGRADDATMAAMCERFATWVAPLIENATFRAWIAEAAGRPVASASLWLKPLQPGLRGEFNSVPYVLNVYTHPEHRNRGLSRRLMETIIDVCRAEGRPDVELHTSEFGRHLYESLGFKPTNELRLSLQ